MSEIEIVNLKRDIEKLSNETNASDIASLKGDINYALFNLKNFPSFENFKKDFFNKLSNNIKHFTSKEEDFKFDFLGKGLDFIDIYNKFKENRILNYILEKFTAVKTDFIIKEEVTVFDTVKSNSSDISFSFNLKGYYTDHNKNFSIYDSKDFKKQTGGLLINKRIYIFNLIVTKKNILPLPPSPRTPLTIKAPTPLFEEEESGSAKHP